MNIRVYQPSDRDRIVEITVEAFHGVSIEEATERKFGPINDHDWRFRKARSVAAELDNDPSGAFVMEDDDQQIIGYITTFTNTESGVGNIPNLAVAAGHRGQGVGRRLIDRALEHFRNKDMQLARIETLAHNATGEHLYTSLGFEEVTRQIHFAKRLD